MNVCAGDAPFPYWARWGTMLLQSVSDELKWDDENKASLKTALFASNPKYVHRIRICLEHIKSLLSCDLLKISKYNYLCGGNWWSTPMWLLSL